MIPHRVVRHEPADITLDSLLLVEGDTPLHFFEAMLQHLRLQDRIEIRSFRGIGQLRPFLRALVKSAAFQSRAVTSLGIIRDAETDAARARQSVLDALSAAGLAIGESAAVKVSVFILPDDTNPGMLETLCMAAVRDWPETKPAHECVEQFFECLQRNRVNLPDGLPRAKNEAQAYLATRPEAQLFPGLAAYRGYWPWESRAFEPVKRFLKSLAAG
ncbi:MAG: hypothetical protein GXP27_05085 [Planctomycetes bacterium]|nr:hypothetical protein [Planctomycetota bacterium]